MFCKNKPPFARGKLNKGGWMYILFTFIFTLILSLQCSKMDVPNGMINAPANPEPAPIIAQGIWSKDTLKRVFYLDGNVGIGTSTPDASLTIGSGVIQVSPNYNSVPQIGQGRVSVGQVSIEGDWPALKFNSYWNASSASDEYIQNGAAFGIIYNKTNKNLEIKVASSGTANSSLSWINAMSIMPNGKVGIGTSAPEGSFTVQSDETLERGKHIMVKGKTNANLKGYFGIATASSPPFLAINFVEEGVTWRNIAIANVGWSKVGIGTSAPTEKLEVAGNIKANRIKINGNNFLELGAGVVGKQVDAGKIGYQVFSTDALDIVGAGSTGPTRKIKFWNEGGATFTGKVGIGTTNATAKLHVGGNMKIDGTNVLEFGAGVAGKQGDAGKIGYQVFSTNALDIVGAGSTAPTRKIKFWNEGGATFVGNVGIGTSTPGKQLHVTNAMRIGMANNTYFYDMSWSFNNLIIDANGDTNYREGLGTKNGSGNIVFRTAAGSNIGGTGVSVDRMIINKFGKVGIAMTNPLYPIHVGTNATNGNGAHLTNGGVWTNASSRASKKDIKALDAQEAIEALTKLNPVTYYYRNETREKYVGFIAEDVPSLVAMNKRKTLSPMDIVAVNTKVLQSHQAEIKSYQRQLKNLKLENVKLRKSLQQENAKIKASVARLQKMVMKLAKR